MTECDKTVKTVVKSLRMSLIFRTVWLFSSLSWVIPGVILLSPGYIPGCICLPYTLGRCTLLYMPPYTLPVGAPCCTCLPVHPCTAPHVRQCVVSLLHLFCSVRPPLGAFLHFCTFSPERLKLLKLCFSLVLAKDSRHNSLFL